MDDDVRDSGETPRVPPSPVAVAGARAGVFGAVGMGPEDERVYRAILARPQVDVDRVASATGLPVADVARAVAHLDGLGVVVRLPAGRLAALPPEVTFGLLIAQRQDALERVRHEACRLATAVPHERIARQTDLDGPHAVTRAREGLIESAERELAWVGLAGLDMRAWDRADRRVRWILDRRHVDDPIACAALDAINGAGGRARVILDLPFGLVIADRQRAILTTADDTHGLYLAGPPLIDLALGGFDALWASGGPITDESVRTGETLPQQHRRLLALLAAGVKDEAAARQLHVSARTVVRRVDRLMRELGADTRFQAGLHAARRGWL